MCLGVNSVYVEMNQALFFFFFFLYFLLFLSISGEEGNKTKTKKKSRMNSLIDRYYSVGEKKSIRVK